MIEIVPYKPDHARAIQAQDAQIGEVDAEALAAPAGFACTALVDGCPVACAGLVEVWSGRSYAWALLASNAGAHMLAITRSVRRALDAKGCRRVEMAVDAGFAAGARWAEMLGFVREGLCRAYLPNGRDAYLYARVR